MVHECTKEASNPSEKVIELQRESASAAFAEFEDEDGLVASTPAILPGISSASCFKAEAEQASGKAHAKTKARTTSRSTKQPNAKQAQVLATRQRAKTMREYEAAKMSLIKARVAGEEVLEKTAYEVHATSQQVEEDVTLDIIRSRMSMVQAALVSSTGSVDKNKEADLHLYELCMADPYLRDFQSTLLASEEGVQTYGSITYVRETTLELQPTVEKVSALMDNQRNALAVLTKIAASLLSESACWKNGVAALKKARLEEERAYLRAQEKLKKQEEAKRAAEEARRKKKEAKDAAKAEAMQGAEEKHALEDQKDDHGGGDETDKKHKGRHRRTVRDLEETDPSVLRHLRSSQLLSATRTVDTIPLFLEQIASIPGVLAVARLKKGSVRKVLLAPRHVAMQRFYFLREPRLDSSPCTTLSLLSTTY